MIRCDQSRHCLTIIRAALKINDNEDRIHERAGKVNTLPAYKNIDVSFLIYFYTFSVRDQITSS